MGDRVNYGNGVEGVVESLSPESSSQPWMLVVVFPGYRQQVTQALLKMGYKSSDYDIATDIEDGRRRAPHYSIVVTDNSQVANNAPEGTAIKVDRGKAFSDKCLDVDAVDFQKSLAERIKGICDATKEEAEYAAAQEPEPGDRRYKLLIIEDDENQRELYRQELGALYDLVLPDTVEDAVYAVQELKDLGIDAMVADQTLWTDVTGLQLLAQAAESNPGIPEILYTGNDDALATAREEGYTAVKRSADIRPLKSAIAELLKGKGAEPIGDSPFASGAARRKAEKLGRKTPEKPDETPGDRLMREFEASQAGIKSGKIDIGFGKD